MAIPVDTIAFFSDNCSFADDTIVRRTFTLAMIKHQTSTSFHGYKYNFEMIENKVLDHNNTMAIIKCRLCSLTIGKRHNY